MKNYIKKVEDFHNAFKVRVGKTPISSLGHKRNALRFDLMWEENDEYLQAADNEDLIEVADALGDMLYILCGTIIEHGMQDKIEDVFNEIHRSNMSKLDEHGLPIFREDGKVLKSDRYFKPELKKFFK